MPIYIFSKWMVVSLYKRYQSRKSAVPQPHYFTLPDGRVRYLPWFHRGACLAQGKNDRS